MLDMTKPNKQLKSKDRPSDLFDRVVMILEQARSHVVRSVNHYMVLAYWQIGGEIVQEQQQGKTRAEYGKQVIKGLSESLTARYGRGFSIANLKNIRQFYLCYQERSPEIGYPAGSPLAASEQGSKRPQTTSSTKSYPPGSQSGQGFHPDLGWSHYVLDEDNQQIFASRYKLELPDETQLAAEIKREMGLIQEQEKE
jgi:hypothetical protein